MLVANKKLKQRRDRKKKKIRRKKKEEEEEGERDGDEEEDHVEEEEEEAEEKEGGRNGVGIMVENEFRPPRCWWQIRSSSREGKQKKKTLHLGPLILPFVLPRLLSSF